MSLRTLALYPAALFCLVPIGAVTAAPKPVASQPRNTGFDVPASAILKTAPPASAYPDAGAVTLRDETVVHLNQDGSATETSHETVKIFNQRGRSHADVAFGYNQTNQALSAVHARTILPTGKFLIVPQDDIHESSPYSDYTMYDDARAVGISMPGVEDGAIVDYTYTLTTRKALLPGQYSSKWAFQDGQDPVKLSRITISAPTAMVLQMQPHNAPGLKPTTHVSADGARKTYIWEMRDLSDITPEPLMPPAETLLASVDISTVPSWQTISRWYQGLAAPQMVATPEIRALVKTLTAGKTTDTDKAKALFYWVEGKTRYVALELGLSAFQPHAADAVCRNRYGDCKDMATLLVTMLHEAGIKTAWPVLLNAGDPLPVHDHLASLEAFDHAIVRADIDGQPYWFDCTAELSSWGDIPGGDRGADAFVIRDGVGTFETIPVGKPDENSLTTTTRVTLSADGSADCDTATKATGDMALGMRAGFRSIKPDQLKTGIENLVGRETPNASLTHFTVSPPEERDTPMSFNCAYHAPLWAAKTGDMLIYTPHSVDDKLFALPERQFPIYQSQVNKLETDAVVTLPPGYVVEEKPADVHENTPLGAYDMTYTMADGTLTQHMVVTDIPALVPAADYPRLKAQFEAMVAEMRRPLVFKQATKQP